MSQSQPRSAENSALDNYILSLKYDPRRLLAVQEDGASESIPATTRSEEGNAVIITTKKQHSLRKSLSEVAIMRPSAGVIFPAALVLADQALMEGLPVPIGLPRGPATISIDLPGLGKSSRLVASPSNSVVQDAITDMLKEWLQQAGPQGFVNAARSYIQSQYIYSSQQVALELGFNAKWTSGSASAQLKASSSSESSSVLAYFKQIFYTVTIDTPSRPSDFFADSVTLGDLQQVVSAEHPPAYVRSVDYGRILMIKMDTTSSETKAHLQAALQQVAERSQVGGSVDATYTDIVKNSTFNVVAIGGSAQAAAQFSGNQEDLTRLRDYIAHDATYRSDNPGSPISYIVAFLKDHYTAMMGFTTDYTETESVCHANGYVELRHTGVYVARFTVTWEQQDKSGNWISRKVETGNQTAGFTKQVSLPGDARNVKILGEAATGLAWNPWAEAMNITLDGVPNKWYRISGTTLKRRWDQQE